jgi:hypothetical protein
MGRFEFAYCRFRWLDDRMSPTPKTYNGKDRKTIYRASIFHLRGRCVGTSKRELFT